MKSKIVVLAAICSMQLIPNALADSPPPELRPQVQSTETSTTTTATTTTTTSATPAATITIQKSTAFGGLPSLNSVRSDSGTARRLAKYHWLDKAAEANPQLIQAIAAHHTAARILAKHPRLGEIAEAEPYLCRLLTKWKDVARIMVQNGEAEKVIARDPQGLYLIIPRDKATARRLARNPMFDEMIMENPDLGNLVAKYM